MAGDRLNGQPKLARQIIICQYISLQLATIFSLISGNAITVLRAK